MDIQPFKKQKIDARPSDARDELKREEEPEFCAAELARRGVRTRPFDFQLSCINFMSRSKNVALLDAMGLGKTFQVLCAIRADPPSTKFIKDALVAKRYRGNTLVICPKIVMNQWASEYERHLVTGSKKAFIYHSKTAHVTPLELCSNVRF